MNALHEVERAIKQIVCPRCARTHLNALLSCGGHDTCQVVVRCRDCGYSFLPDIETASCEPIQAPTAARLRVP